MQRTLKFRFWDKHAKVFLNSYQGDYEYTVEGLANSQIHCVRRFLGEHDGIVASVIIQQFTGFIDINGKEIYEGDIVNFYIPAITHGPEREDYQNKEVWFDVDCGEWSFGRLENGCKWTFGWNQIKGVEVVGNIFE